MTRGGRALGPRLGDAGRRTSCSGSRSRRHAYAPPQNLIDRLWPYFMIDRLYAKQKPCRFQQGLRASARRRLSRAACTQITSQESRESRYWDALRKRHHRWAAGEHEVASGMAMAAAGET